MKSSLIMLLAGSLLFPGLELNADILDSEDDNYLGLQVSIPLGASPTNNALAKAEYSFLVVNRNNGITDGVVWTHGVADTSTFGYLRPSNTFTIGSSRVSDYTVPLASIDAGGEMSISRVTEIDGGDLIMYTIGGIYLIANAIDDALDDLDDSDDDEPDDEPDKAPDNE